MLWPQLRPSRRLASLFGVLNGALVIQALIATRGGTGAFRAGPFSGTLLVAWGEAPIVVSFLVLRSMVAAFLAGSISTALVVGSFWTLLTSENSTAGPNVIAPLVALTAVAVVASAEAMARWLRHRAER